MCVLRKKLFASPNVPSWLRVYKSMCQIQFDQKFGKPELTQIQHEENGYEKLLWPFLETSNVSRLGEGGAQ